MNFCNLRTNQLALRIVIAAAFCLSITQRGWSADYFLTIGGGYNRSGNQASLEANVLFFQQVLKDKHSQQPEHTVYFADGADPAADLQVLAEKPAVSETPATDLIGALHRRRGAARVTYRNHQVPNIAGPLDPNLIRESLEKFGAEAKPGDRLIVYVTAHGSNGPESDPFNTTIDCWNERKITVREFDGWLNKLPPEIPVVMVMAQCYCGGFGRLIFDELDSKKGISNRPRCGFFAQQHDLPAAGCRPDIEHDEEFSSYFWGALAGRSRNGVPIADCDLDGNGRISFDEAFTHAVVAGETIDIPLRTSEVFLRAFSRLTPEDATDKKAASFAAMNGPVQILADRGRLASRRIITQLCARLELPVDGDVQTILDAAEKHRRSARFGGRGGGRGRRGSGRRELMREITEKWPELGDARHWEESPLLKADNQEKLLAEIKELPSWKTYEERFKQMETASDEAEQHELRGVKFRRLINTLETVVLEANLPLCESPEIVDKFQKLMKLEESSLEQAGGR